MAGRNDNPEVKFCFIGWPCYPNHSSNTLFKYAGFSKNGSWGKQNQFWGQQSSSPKGSGFGFCPFKAIEFTQKLFQFFEVIAV
jgi:hypothetical protein